MNLFSVLFLLLFSTGVFADFKLESEHAPNVVFSMAQSNGQSSVEARVSYTVSNDGAVSDVEVMGATDPKFGEAVRKAMTQRKFKPWPLEGNPETVRYETVFVHSMDNDLDETYRSKVGGLRCNDLNEEVAQFRLQHPGQALREMALFTETLIALRLVSMLSPQKITHEQSMRWHDVLSDAFSQAISTCLNNPEGTYLNALPASLRDRFQA
jgi:TonB family protein